MERLSVLGDFSDDQINEELARDDTAGAQHGDYARAARPYADPKERA